MIIERFGPAMFYAWLVAYVVLGCVRAYFAVTGRRALIRGSRAMQRMEARGRGL